MGMYTELIFGAELKHWTPESVVKTLEYLIGKSLDDSNLEFQTKSGRRLYGGSYYFGVNKSVNEMWYDDISESYHVSIRCNIKNYENEIQDFLDWIKPYIKSGSGERDMYAIVMYEESSSPTIYYLRNMDKKEQTLDEYWHSVIKRG